MKKPLRTLIYGQRHEHGPDKLAAVLAMPDDFEVVAVADDSSRTSPTYAICPTVLDGVRTVSEREALAMNDIDCVFIETANGDLMEIASVYADRGIPMHCDKPYGEAMEPYRTITEKCRAKNIPIQAGYMFRANPAVRFCRDAVREGWLGDVTFIEADMNHNYGNDDYQRYVGSFRGGILYNLGCHIVDIVAAMLPGMPQRAHPVIGTAHGDPKCCLNRTASLLEWGDASVLIRACSRAAGSQPYRRLRIDGTRGVMELCPIERFDGESLKVDMTLDRPVGGYEAGRHIVDFGVFRDRYRWQLELFARMVRGESPNDDMYDHDLRVHEITLMTCGY